MIKSIVEKIMIKQFSKYINGIQYNKLTIEVLGGFFSIENISLNQSFFNGLETPFSIAYSHIGKLSIEAPLTKLSSVPVSCTIEDVYVIVEHKKHFKLNCVISKEQILKKYINETFDVLVNKIKDANKQQGMMDKLGKKVLDNLKLQVKNIHIRFEQSNPHFAYSFGVALKSLTFGTTDRQWKPIFIERQKTKEEQPIFKAMAIQNFKVYWQSIPKQEYKTFLFLNLQKDSERIESMRKFVTNDKDSILKINSLIKVTINPISMTNQPLFEVQIDLQPINIKFSKQKIVQILDFTTSCIKYNEIMLKTLLDKALKKLTQQQEKRYKPLCAKYVQSILEKDRPKLSELQFKDLFDNLIIQHLYELSMPFIKEKVQQQREKELKKQKKGWFSKAEVQLTPQQKMEVEKLLNELAEDSMGKGRPQQCHLLKLVLRLKQISFIFYDQNASNKLKTIQLKIQNIICKIEKSHNNSYFSVQSKIKRILADLTVSEDKSTRNIQLMENICDNQTDFLIDCTYRENVKVAKKTIIHYYTDLTLKKTIFTYKKEYWNMFQSFFSLPQINQQVQNQAMGKLELLKKKDSSSEDEDQVEIEKYYSVNISLDSPSIILPLTEKSYWYLDLGKITMKSETLQKKFIYPFKLSELNMRYITQQNSAIKTQSIIKNNKFFPILKNINVEVNMIKSRGQNSVDFQIFLDKIEISATKQEFMNLMKVKKFLVGGQRDQKELHHQQMQKKDDIINKTRLFGKVHKRNKYLLNWIQFQCYFSNNSLYFYPTERELVPETIISLRGAKVAKNVEVDGNDQTLELVVSGESIYLQFKDQQMADKWQKQINKNINELKDLHSLILEGNLEQHKKKRKQKQDLINIQLKLNEINWNYLNQKGQSFMKIELKTVQFRVIEQEERVKTVFNIDSISIVDKVYLYQNPKYQHLFIAHKISLDFEKIKEKVTAISPIMINTKMQALDINWKPDSLLLIIQSLKEFMNIKVQVINRNNNRAQVVQAIKDDIDFNQKIQKYNKESQDESLKEKREDYLKLNSKDDQIYVKFGAQISNLNIAFIHRQSHMPMFLLKSKQLSTKVTTGKIQNCVSGTIKTIQLYQISGYPQKQYEINKDYEPYCIIKKKNSLVDRPILEFRYSSYQPESIPNKERTDSFMKLHFSPLTINYYQQVAMRLIDYSLIQIIMLLNHSQVVTVNEDILKQLLSNSAVKGQKPKNFLEDEFENVVKRLFHPFFMDYFFLFQEPQIILSPTKTSTHYFILNMQKIELTNRQIRTSKRFSSIKYSLKDSMFEQQLQIRGSKLTLSKMNMGKCSLLISNPFQISLTVNRLLFEDEINQITPQISGYDRSFKIENIITAIKIPELSKLDFENLIRLPNFNLNFEDQNNELFIHNYRITKTLSPKPIQYSLRIEEVSTVAIHCLQQNSSHKLNLWSISIKGFMLKMNRDDKLNTNVEINLEQATANTYEYSDLNDLSSCTQKTLAHVNKSNNVNSCFAIIKLPNTGIIDIQACVEQSELNINFGVMPLIAGWVLPDDSVFPVSKKENRLIKFLIRLPKVIVNLQESYMFDRSLRMVGQLIIQAKRYEGESQNYLKNGYENRSIQPNYIENLGQFMNIKVNLGFEFFCRLKDKDRKIVDKVKIELREENYYKVRDDQFRKTLRRRLTISQMRGSISIDDILLFKSVVEVMKKGQEYQRSFRQTLKQFSIMGESINKSMVNKSSINEKILQQLVFKVESIKFYLIHKQKNELIPMLRLSTNKIEILQFVNQKNEVFNGQFDLQAYYFNNIIFRWEPFIESFRIKANLTNQKLTKTLEADIINPIYINVSSEMAVSIKKLVKDIEEKMDQYQQRKYVPQEGDQYESKYVIKNLTGYPIEIYDETHKSQYVVMHEQSVNYTSKRLRQNFFQQNQIKETFSFLILHPSIQLLEVSDISIQTQKSFNIELYSNKGIKLPQNCQIYLENQIQGWKKIMTIRSKKCISDYSNNSLVKKYYPFDFDEKITFTQGNHKGMKVSFYNIVKNERYNYYGNKGNLVIRKNYLVYNYTLIPLNVCDSVVIPGEFVGINGSLTIQGRPYQQSFLKVIFNQIKKQYYIYSISYIIDYTGLIFSFDKQYQINQLYSYCFKQDNKEVRIYILPEINFDFTVRKDKNSTSMVLSGKLARQNFQLTGDSSIYSYSCYSYLQSFTHNNIKDFKKVIEVTDAYFLCNDTTETLHVRQVDTIQRQKIQLKPGENKVFYWANKFLKELVTLTIADKDNCWSYSPPLTISKNIDTFFVRNQKEPNKYKIYGLELEETDNITFIHIISAQDRYQIKNDLQDITITLYQQAIFQKQNSPYLVKDIDPRIFTYQIKPKQTQNFGFGLPLHDHRLNVHLELDPSIYGKQTCQPFTIQDIQNNVIDRSIDLQQSNLKIHIKLEFNRKNKVLRFFIKRREIFQKTEEVRLKLTMKSINLGLIGNHDNKRKELINACFSQIGFGLLLNDQFNEINLSVSNIRIENTIRPQPYFISLITQEESKSNGALVFVLKRSRFNSNLVYYIGFSMKKSIITVTSEELEILEMNINSILEKLNERSDTSYIVNMHKKFIPEKIRHSQKLYFVLAQLHPLKLILTYKHVNNWGGALLKALSMNDCKVTVDGKKIKNFACKDLLDFMAKMGKHFKDQLENQIFSMIGSLALLGSPLNLASKIGCGIQNLIQLPADGFEDGLLGMGKGLAMGTGSLLSNTVEGAFGSVQSITGAIGEGLSGLASYDKDYQKKRQSIKNERVDHVGDGLMSGGKSIFNGFYTGITGLFKQPIKGAEKEGVGGFFMGGLKGLTGLIVKPVTGVIDATSKTAEGIKNTTKVFSEQTKLKRTRKYNPRPFYGYYRQIRPYDNNLAEWNKQIGIYSSKYSNLSWCDICSMKNGQIVIISYQYILVFNKNNFQLVNQIDSSNIVSIVTLNPRVEIVWKNQENQKYKLQFQPKQYTKFVNQVQKLQYYYRKSYEISISRKQTPKK